MNTSILNPTHSKPIFNIVVRSGSSSTTKIGNGILIQENGYRNGKTDIVWNHVLRKEAINMSREVYVRNGRKL